MKKILCAILALFIGSTLYAQLNNLNPNQLQEAIDKGVKVIDIRTASEWKETGVVPSAHKLTFFDEKGKYDVQAWMKKFSKIVSSKDEPFILVCRSGNRTTTVGKFLDEQLQYKKVYHLQHGIKSWLREKREVSK